MWRRGSVVASWLLDLTAHALLAVTATSPTSRAACPTPARAAGRCHAAIDEGVPADVLSAALFARFTSRGSADFADKLLSAMRKEFGGHDEKLDQTIGETKCATATSDALVLLRHVGRPRPQEDLPRALLDGEAAASSHVPGDRRRVVAVDGRRPARTAPATASPSTAAGSTTRPRSSTLTELAALRRRRLQRPGDVHDAASRRSATREAPGALPRDPAEHVRDRGRGRSARRAARRTRA